MKFTSQISRFSSYLNGETPYVKNGNWWIGDTDTGVAAQAVDGVSFSGIVEYYFATLATDVDASGTPKAPKWDKATWFTKIQDTKFGTKDNNGVTYKYLWNVEIVKSTSADGKVSETASDVELFLTHNDSRIPAEYISYYAASVTSVAPEGNPILGENNNYISGPDNPIWKIADDYTGSADESAFLFEISFVKYAEKDEKGHNLYALLSGPSMIGHNGANGPKGDDAVTYSLSVIPNSWNKSLYPNISPSFVVTQHVGSEIVEMQNGYIIKVGETVWGNGSITEDTTFDLYVNDVLVDSETITAVSNGVDGKTPIKGKDYFDGTNGTDGVSIVWKGEFDKAPSNPQNGWAYYNTEAKASYTYSEGVWYQMSVDGVDGQKGADGTPIIWKGESSGAPSNPELNWVYKDTDDKKVYIYNGTGWELMVLDGSDGADGAPGTDGLSVFITYNHNEEKPNKPTGNGNENGWSTTASADAIWMSQKIAASSSEGDWGDPIKIKGEKGAQGRGVSSIVNYYLASTQASGITHSTSGWQQTVPATSENKPYLWNYELITYSSGSPASEKTAPRMIGSVGIDGDDGRGVSSITEQYYAWTIGVTPVENSPWIDTIPTLTPDAPCLWCKETINYTTGSPDVFIRLIAQRGQDGQDGRDGNDGQDGQNGSTGTKTEAVRVFAYNTSNSAPTLTNSTPIGTTLTGISARIWTTAEIPASSTYQYVFTSTGVKTTTYSGTVAQPSTYSEWTTPELWSAYHVNIGGKEYATFLKLTNNGAAQGLKYDNGDLYINASYINTGTLTVGGSSSPTFSANVSSGTASIAGWTVSRSYGIYGNSYKVGMVDPTAGSSNFSRTSLISGSSKIVFYAGSIDPTGGSTYLTKIPEFAVLADGSLYASAAQITGSITAKSGYIGPSGNNSFKIEEMTMTSSGTKYLAIHRGLTYNSSGTYYSFTNGDFPLVLCPYGVKSASNLVSGGTSSLRWVFLAGKVSSGVVPFGITDQGALYASEGSIGGWILSTSSLYGKVSTTYCGLQKPSVSTTKVFYAGATSTAGAGAKFYVQNDGTLYANTGTLATGCVLGPNLNIGSWNTNFTALYSGSAINANSIGATTSASTAGLLIVAAEESSCAINCRSAGGQSYMNAGKLYVERTGSYVEYVSISCNNPAVTLHDNGTCGELQGAYADSQNTLQCRYYGITGKLELGQMNYSNQAIVISGSYSAYKVATKGTWSGSISGSSDYRLKKNICNLNDKYEDFFDLLSPASFEFYKPSDGRDVGHVGFIAQEVQDAIKWSGLEEREWGGLVTYPEQDRTYYALTYTEFVALNTWQIQKLKPRMTMAEQEIESLKLEIAQLREEIKNLQNS